MDICSACNNIIKYTFEYEFEKSLNYINYSENLEMIYKMMLTLCLIFLLHFIFYLSSNFLCVF